MSTATTGADTLDGTVSNDLIDGLAGNDSLRGLAGNDTLDGGAGNDTLAGGLGDDTFRVDSADDVIQESIGAGQDLVESSVSYGLNKNGSAEIEDLTLTGTADIDATGNSLNNSLTGNSGANVLDGARGDDMMTGGAGNDTYVVDSLNDSVVEDSGGGTDLVKASINYSLASLVNVEDLTLTGTATIATGNTLANVLTGNSLANTLDGGAGADNMSGGLGNDTYIVDNAGDIISGETDTGGVDLVQSSVSYTLGTGVENLTLTGSGANNATGTSLGNFLTGNSAANRLFGLLGQDTLNGGAGADTLEGGDGDDTYIVDALDTVTETSTGGKDTVQSALSYTLAANSFLENLTLTGTSSISGFGNELANILTGNAAANTLDGGVGIDTMVGGAGNDTYKVDNALDKINEIAGAGDDTVTSTVSFTLPAYVENLVLTGTALIDGTGIGNSLVNTITGNALDNTLDGKAGADEMIGGAGDDKYIVDNVGDITTEVAAQGTDEVLSSVTYTLLNHVENLTLTGTALIDGTGNTLNNKLVGSAVANTLTGDAGDDTLDGGAGADSLVGGLGNDTYLVDQTSDKITEVAGEGTDLVQSTALNYTLSANVEDLTLTGTAAINGTGNSLGNTLIGNSGANKLDGGAGIDMMDGGMGNDIYIVDAADSVVEDANAGTDLVRSSVTYTLATNVENLELTGSGTISGTGNTLANLLTGNSVANTLTGGVGADDMRGGAGNDTYNVDNTGDKVVEVATGGAADLVNSSVTYALNTTEAAYVENLTLTTGAGAINATGNSLANILTGNESANKLDGLGGADEMIGGAGNDTYGVNNVGDVVTEVTGGGTDLVESSIADYTLPNFVDNLLLIGTAKTGTGNSLSNSVTGNALDNTLSGGTTGEIDTMTGGGGNDTFIVDNTNDVVKELSGEGTDKVLSSVSFSIAALSNVENLTLTGTAAVGTGSSLSNLLIGNSVQNTLSGAAGSDTLDGGAGIDSMAGGLDNDTYIVDDIGDIIYEISGQGADLVKSSVTYSLSANLESLTLVANAGAIDGTGNTLGNIILGNSSDNRLDGGTGADTLTGGKGDDTYVVDVLADRVTELAAEGTDTIETAITYTLGAYIENLTLTGGAKVTGTGNSLKNFLTGNSVENTLSGGVGIDTMAGGAGNDTYAVENIADEIQEITGGGTDTVQSSVTFSLANEVENLTLTGKLAIDGTGNSLANVMLGNSLANTLSAGDGNDTLDGGLGADSMEGGAGDDVYTVNTALDTITEDSISGSGNDTVQSSVTYSLASNVENLTLTGALAINGTGNELGNKLTGNASANRLDGGTGADSMAGGVGDDVYIIDDVGDMVTEAANAGTDTERASLTRTLDANVENLTLTGTENIDGTGNSLNNFITGNSGANSLVGAAGTDTLNGGAGVDTLVGGQGNDTYYVDNASDVVVEIAGEGVDVVNSSVTYSLANNIEALTLTGAAAIQGTGNSLTNTLNGNTGNNTLDGGIGSDSMVGGKGNDVYIVDNISDNITEQLGEGQDTMESSVNVNIALNVEVLKLTGTANLIANGDSYANFIYGNSGDNRLNGQGGADSMFGGLGNDTYTVDVAGDQITEDDGQGTDMVQSSITYSLGNFVENLQLTGLLSINATGNSLGNKIQGNTYDNILDGGAGADEMSGASGNDTYFVDNTGDTIIEGLNGGTDSVQSSVTFALSNNVENLTLTGTSAINGTGNGMANIVTGNASANYIFTSGNNDTIDGGAGNDTIEGGQGVDSLTGGTGTDVFRFSISESGAYTFAEVAGAGGVSTGDTFTGSFDVVTDFVAGTDSIVASTGTLASVRGNYVGNVFTVDTSAGVDTLAYFGGMGVVLRGITSMSVINGTAAADTLNGSTANDTITGGLGADVINGGSGVDTYIFGTGDSISTGFDTITVTNGDILSGGGLSSTLAVTAPTGAQNTTDLVALNDLITALQEASGIDVTGGGSATYLLSVTDSQATPGTNYSGFYLVSEFSGTATLIDSNDVVVKLVGVSGGSTISFSGNDIVVTV